MMCEQYRYLTLSQLMSHKCEWYHKTNKVEDTNKLTLLAFKIIAILHNTRLATSMAAIQQRVDRFLKRPLLTVSRSFMNVANRVL
jgi:hypothetical protein